MDTSVTPNESIRATRPPPNLKVPFHMFVPGAFRSLIHESIGRLFRLAKSASKKGGCGYMTSSEFADCFVRV